MIKEDIKQQSSAPVFVADRLLAYGNPAGASEARRSAHSKKPLCKRTHSATMRSASTKLLIASLREEKHKIVLNTKKRPIEAFFSF
jgi:hypothetical protein